MKIIAFGDIHMATSALLKIKDLATADLVIAGGDITNFGNRSDAKIVLNEILEFNKNLLCLAGNLDNSDVNDYLDDLNMNLHAQAHVIKRMVCIYGVGGSNRTPFNTPWEFEEDELLKIAQEGHLQAKELIDLAKPITGYAIPTIFVSHAPPFRSKLDRLVNGKHVGSKAVRKFIEINQPTMSIVNHIHESKGEDIIGNTRIINPGMLASNSWVTLEINRNSIQATLQ